MAGEKHIRIAADGDVVTARRNTRHFATELGFSSSDVVALATAVSEVGRNIVTYAQRGEIILTDVEEAARRGLTIVARDQGGGISDIPLAMQDGYSSSDRLGLGLPGARRLMDAFDIVSEVGTGTTITMTKWVR